MNHDDIRDRLQAMLGNGAQFHVSESLWEYLLREGKITQVERGAKSINWLVDAVRDFWQASGTYDRRYRADATLPKDASFADRRDSLSFVLGQEASRSKAVVDFRRTVLRRNLLSHSVLAQWVERQAKRDGPPTAWLTVALPPRTTIRLPLRIFKTADSRLSVNRRLLEYAVEGSMWVQRIPIAAAGVLDRLRQIAEELAASYGWQPAQAATFVLTGAIPMIPQIKGGTSTAARGRIILDVDPTTTPRQVAAAYRRYRKQILKGARLRTLTQKHFRLAVFAARRSGVLSAADMRTWNRQNPASPYREEKLFRRDGLTALKRVNASVISFETQLDSLAELTPKKEGPKP
jgi:hypothetical protein